MITSSASHAAVDLQGVSSPGGRVLLSMLALLGALHGEPGHAFELVSEEQAQQDRQAQLEPNSLLTQTERRLRGAGLAGPQLELLAPTASGPLRSPLDIALRWRTEEGFAIDPTSLRVLYGVLKLDITTRVLANAKVSPAGLDAKGAQLPPGVHRIFVQVTDTAKRVAQRELVLEILGQ